MTDALDLLLQGKQHVNVQELLKFHHSNPEFLPRIVAEFRLLKQLGHKAAQSNHSLIFFVGNSIGMETGSLKSMTN